MIIFPQVKAAKNGSLNDERISNKERESGRGENETLPSVGLC